MRSLARQWAKILDKIVRTPIGADLMSRCRTKMRGDDLSYRLSNLASATDTIDLCAPFASACPACFAAFQRLDKWDEKCRVCFGGGFVAKVVWENLGSHLREALLTACREGK